MRARASAVVLLAALGSAAAIAVTTARADDPAPPATVTVTTQAVVDGHPAWWWRRRSAVNYRRWAQADRNAAARALTVRRLKRTLAHSPSVTEALALARVVYGVDQQSRANCESHKNPRAKNKHSDASGLLQFMPGTWSTTPFAGFSIWSPYAASLAGGWMVAVAHRSAEWACAL